MLLYLWSTLITLAFLRGTEENNISLITNIVHNVNVGILYDS
jgi:hypothetical protein